MSVVVIIKKHLVETTKAIRPEEYFFIFFTLLVLVLQYFYGGDFIFYKRSAWRFAYGLIILIFINYGCGLVSLVRSSNSFDYKYFVKKILVMLRDWLPFVLIILVYENLHDLVKLINPNLADPYLMKIDQWLFGTQPTIWLEKFIQPWLTSYMMSVYNLMYFMPALLAALLYAKRLFGDFRHLMLALVITFYLGLVGYVLVPAIGPRFVITDQYSVGLVGSSAIYDYSEAIWNGLERIDRDCFPSLHTAVAAVALFFSYKFRRRFKYGQALFVAYFILAISTWLATVYLRYHWVIDVVAGLWLSVLAFWLGPKVDLFWCQKIRRLPTNINDKVSFGVVK